MSQTLSEKEETKREGYSKVEKDHLKEIFLNAGRVMSGTLAKRESVGPGGNQAAYRFKECEWYRGNQPPLGNEYKIKQGEAWLGFYNGQDGELSEAKLGDRVVVFYTKDYGRLLDMAPADPWRLAALRQWKMYGATSEDDLKTRAKDAEGIVIVEGGGGGSCGESEPCHHGWVFKVSKVLKGELNEGAPIRVSGSYGGHDGIPAPLKTADPASKYILLCAKDNARLRDTDILDILPWQSRTERKIRDLLQPAPKK